MGKTINIYVDESGNFGDFRDSARYCMVTLVFHSQSERFVSLWRKYRDAIFMIGADPDSMVFHTAPIIRQEEQFSAMSRNMRGRLFYQMLSFVRLCDLKYASFVIDTSFVTSTEQIVASLQKNITRFFLFYFKEFSLLDSINLHYDAGQKNVTRILDSISAASSCPVNIVQGARQQNDIMLQIADFICTIKLIEQRLADGLTLNSSETKFFGSPRDFYRNVLRKIKAKEYIVQ